MKGLALLVACVSCALAIPAYILPFSSGRGTSWIRQVLDCPPLLYGGYDTTRCRQLQRRSHQAQPQRMTVLEIVEEEEPGRVQVVHDEHAGTFAIKVPHKFDLGKPKCEASEIYVSELDICVPAEDHVIKPKHKDSGKTKRDQQKQKEDKKEPVLVLQVGSYEKEKCNPGEIWVPEVAACLDKNPPPPMEPEDDDADYY
ncbi:uncharacterized protein LOC127002047 [Eriocheir sinensis]|uniref:uncharacterized protein LOC126994484 n=1 Tax=Eriocheir sinensis TaxID=95602 RepID=UPI0021C7C2F3|nr:uncharacterized protein LOC126994484 [Eriocheir sinensis]XP_050723367.1 uncharacterized protein LOC127002047 [Eriocheir sinensis]